MDVLFLSPAWPAEMGLFVRGLKTAGAKVYGVGDTPERALPRASSAHLAGYLQVPSMAHAEELFQHVIRAVPGRPDRVEALWEPLIGVAARLRAHYGCPGMTETVAHAFRDKPTMRALVGAAGLPTPHTQRCTSAAAIREAAAEAGYPVVVKPVDGAGSADTHRVNSPSELAQHMAAWAQLPAVTVEPFIEGPEFTYETLSVRGRPVLESVCRYEPNTLVARQNRWISPIILTYRSIPHTLKAGATLGRGVLRALGMGTGVTHMEWFKTKHGPMFGEVAARPPGARMVTLMNHAGGVDLGRLWGQAVVRGHVEPIPPRPWATAIVVKRAEGRGRLRAISGLRRFRQEHGPHLAEVSLLKVGQPVRDWQASFEADGYLIVRHPNAHTCLELARQAARRVRLIAE